MTDRDLITSGGDPAGTSISRASQDASANFDPRSVFLDHYSRQSENTLRRYRTDLRWFALFLAYTSYIRDEDMEAEAAALFTFPEAWSGINADLVR